MLCKIHKIWDKHLEGGTQRDSHSMYNSYSQISVCSWTPAVPLSCSVHRVAKYQLSFTAAPAQAVCGILFLFPTMGNGPLVKKFKGNCLFYIHFKLWFILSLPCKNNLVSPLEKKRCNCSKSKWLCVHPPGVSFPCLRAQEGCVQSLLITSSVLWMLFGCEKGTCSSGLKKLLHFLDIVCMQDPFDPSFAQGISAPWIEHF